VWFSGPGNLNGNIDNTDHAYMVNNYPTPGSTYVGFEDTIASDSDFNYTDLQFELSNTFAIPEPSTFGLLALGALGLLWRKRS
jgi:hypothetical protein